MQSDELQIDNKVKIKAIVFDMDGVLLDTESMSDITWIEAAKQLQVPNIDKLLNHCRGCNKQDTINLLQTHYSNLQNFSGKEFLDLTGDLFSQMELNQGIPLMYYAKECLQFLYERKIPLALASSTKKDSVYRQLTNAGLIQYFTKIVTGDMVTHSKPNPEIYQKACLELGIEPNYCVAIEDSLNGIKSAYSANLKCIMVPDKIEPTKEIMPSVWKLCKNLKEAQNILELYI